MSLSRTRRAGVRAATCGVAVLALTACAGGGPGGSPATAAAPGGAALQVMASFYPLQYVAERVGGERVSVSSITPPVGDAHNIELSPREVADLEAADLVVYLSGFQPAVDDAVEVTGAPALDVVDDAALRAATELVAESPHVDASAGGEAGTRTGTGDDDDHGDGADGHDHGHGDDHDHDHDDDDDHGHDHGGLDPHFWLDPDRLAGVASAVADELAALDPDHADDYRAAAEELGDELAALTQEYANGLAECAASTVVVTHEAYGYLLSPFGLRQEGLAGIDPETEPSPARLAQIADVVAEEDVTTVFVESALSPDVAETFARDLGIATAVLDPLELQQDEDADYQDVMRANLAALRTALVCA